MHSAQRRRVPVAARYHGSRHLSRGAVPRQMAKDLTVSLCCMGTVAIAAAPDTSFILGGRPYVPNIAQSWSDKPVTGHASTSCFHPFSGHDRCWPKRCFGRQSSLLLSGVSHAGANLFSVSWSSCRVAAGECTCLSSLAVSRPLMVFFFSSALLLLFNFVLLSPCITSPRARLCAVATGQSKDRLALSRPAKCLVLTRANLTVTQFTTTGLRC